MESKPTLGSIESTMAEKRKFAQKSMKFNCKEKLFCQCFPELVETYKASQEGGEQEEEEEEEIKHDMEMPLRIIALLVFVLVVSYLFPPM